MSQAILNLEWLRKSAKDLLAEWRQEGRDAKLAQAQHQVARDAGYSTWPAMVASLNAATIAPDRVQDFLQAVGRGDTALVQSALDQTPHIVNAVGDHPFWGGRPQALHLVIEAGRDDLFNLLMTRGADPIGRNGSYDHWSPLMLAAFRYQTDTCARLMDAGAHVGLCETLLLGRDAGLAELVAEWGALNAGPKPQGSLLALARTPHAVEVLVRHGARTEDKDRWGSDVLDALSRLGPSGRDVVAALAEHSDVQPGPVAWARAGDLVAVQQVSNVAQDPLVLIAAVDFGHVEIADWLLQNGADVQARQAWGSKGTALHSAAWNGDLAMVQCLLRHDADITAVDREYRTTPRVWAETSARLTNTPACLDVAQHLKQLETPE